MERTISERGLLAEAVSYDQDLTKLATSASWEQQQEQPLPPPPSLPPHPPEQQQMVYLDPRAIAVAAGNPRHAKNGFSIIATGSQDSPIMARSSQSLKKKRPRGSFDPKFSPGNSSIRKMLRDLSQGTVMPVEGRKGQQTH